MRRNISRLIEWNQDLEYIIGGLVKSKSSAASKTVTDVMTEMKGIVYNISSKYLKLEHEFHLFREYLGSKVYKRHENSKSVENNKIHMKRKPFQLPVETKTPIFTNSEISLLCEKELRKRSQEKEKRDRSTSKDNRKRSKSKSKEKASKNPRREKDTNINTNTNNTNMNNVNSNIKILKGNTFGIEEQKTMRSKFSKKLKINIDNLHFNPIEED